MPPPNRPRHVPRPDAAAHRGYKVVSDPPWWDQIGGWLVALLIAGVLLVVVLAW